MDGCVVKHSRLTRASTAIQVETEDVSSINTLAGRHNLGVVRECLLELFEISVTLLVSLRAVVAYAVPVSYYEQVKETYLM